MKVPILLIVFNRLNCVQKVFEPIRQYKPDSLYIAADGPRENCPADIEKCKLVREWLLSNIDWQCEVHTLFRENNVGCGYGPSKAISWFFESEEEGVVIEDDCVMHIDFFDYCAELLDRYRNNDQIMAINGFSLQPHSWGDASYYFSMQNSGFLGWATWRRAWQYFDFDLEGYSRRSIEYSMRYYKATKPEIKWWGKIYDNLMKGVYGTSAWDYQWIFAIWKRHGYAIMPNVNLSYNVGFGVDATHTTKIDDPIACRKVDSILPLRHPEYISYCREADLYYHRLYYAPHQVTIPLYIAIKRYLKGRLQMVKHKCIKKI